MLRSTILALTLIVVALVLAACQQAAAPEPTKAPKETATSGRQVTLPTPTPPTTPGNQEALPTPTPPTTKEEGTKVTKSYSSAPPMTIDPNKRYIATLDTNQGKIVAELLPKEAPKTVNNFVFLAREGFYDGVKFHRVIKGFMVQTGDPQGTGAGGPGYRFEDEKIVSEYEPGTLAMANAGPNTNGSQFFITHVDLRGRLPKNYTIFGRVTEGMDVVDKIASAPVKASPTGEPSVPTVDLHINTVTIEEK